MKKRKSILIAAVLMTGACAQPKQSSETVLNEVSSSEVSYVSLQIDNDMTNTKHTFVFFSEDGTCAGSYSVNTKGDMSYTYYDDPHDTFYCFGPGGLYGVSLGDEHPLISFISGENINCVIPDSEGRLYMYINGGYRNEGGYDAAILTPSGQRIELDAPVHSMRLHEGLLYAETVYNTPEGFSKAIISVFSTENYELIAEYDRGLSSGMMTEFNDQICIAADDGLYSIEDGTLYPYTGNEEPIGLTSYEGDLFTVDGSEYLLSGEDDQRYIYIIESDGENCSLSKVHNVTDAQNIYGIMGVSGESRFHDECEERPGFCNFHGRCH